nr:hypothetical protein B0A51_07769 [Rachicladosporium sp. CCFEE 5018]
MAPNGTTSRKAPAALQKSGAGKPNGTAAASLFEDLQKTPKIKSDVVSALPVVKKPGNWDDEVVVNGIKKESPPPHQSLLRRPPPDLIRAFTNGKPMSDTPIVLKCNHCKRTVTETGMPKHIERCLNKKQEKSRKKKEAKEARDAAARKERGGGDSDEDEDGEKSAVKGGQAGKKRKATADEDDLGAPASKKKKLKLDAGPKSKPSKLKAPVDVEKQCGVELPQGGQCARSLTCKSHSMGAKRAVPGRSARYDKLLLEYQQKNQAKQQRAVMDANAPDPDDDVLPLGPVDEEAEKEDFMAGIARAWGGAPLWQPSFVSQRKKYENVRLKGMLAAALGGRGGNLFAVPGAPAQAVPAVRPGPIVDADGVVHPRRPSVVPGARSMMAPATSRKASVASVGGA